MTLSNTLIWSAKRNSSSEGEASYTSLTFPFRRSLTAAKKRSALLGVAPLTPPSPIVHRPVTLSSTCPSPFAKGGQGTTSITFIPGHWGEAMSFGTLSR